MEKEYHLAIDIGASSGKSVIGYLKDGLKIKKGTKFGMLINYLMK